MNLHPIDAAVGLLACPVCGDPLSRDERVLTCRRRHSFDIARQGYVNLLQGPAPANADTAAMIAARERFLSSGAYQPIADAVLAACAGHDRIAEVGAGPGYYLGQVVASHQPSAHLALDISVPAARRAARSGLATVVADTWAGLPITGDALSAVLCVFAPRNPAEFARTLTPGGQTIVVTPGPEHLGALRHRLGLLDVPADKLDRLDHGMAQAGLGLADRTEVDYQIVLDPPLAADLVAMGPNAFHRGRSEPAEPILVRVQVFVSSHHR